MNVLVLKPNAFTMQNVYLNKLTYFELLRVYSLKLFDILPLEKEPEPLEQIMAKLQPTLSTIRDAEISKLQALDKPEGLFAPGNELTYQGLNTIGMLMDRFTILLIREWCLLNKHGLSEKAQNVYMSQTTDIIKAMANAAPGTSSLNTKVTTIGRQSSATSTWEEAFYGLLTTNLLLWESQEMLYIKDIKQEPCAELRSYIDWFSKGNIQRNEYIEEVEYQFWKTHLHRHE